MQWPAASQILLTGPPGIAKSKLAVEIIGDFIRSGMKATYATTVLTAPQVRQLVSDELETGSEEVSVIDGVSCIAGRVSSESRSFRSLSELNSMSMVILEMILSEPNCIYVFDNLSTLLIYSNERSVLKFVSVVSAKAKSAGAFGIYILEEGVHEKELDETLSFILDGVIRIREIENQNEILLQKRVEYVRGNIINTEWEDMK